MSEMAHRLPTEPITRQPIYELVSSDGIRLIAEAESLEGLLLCAQTLKDEGEPVGELVVFKGGEYDAGATAMAQAGWVT